MGRKKITEVGFYCKVLLFIFEREVNREKTNSWNIANKFSKECRESSSLVKSKMDNLVEIGFLHREPISLIYEYSMNYEGIIKYIIEKIFIIGEAKEKAYKSTSIHNLLKTYLKHQQLDLQSKIMNNDITLNNLLIDFIVSIAMAKFKSNFKNKNINYNDTAAKYFIQKAQDYIYQLSFKVSSV